MTEASLPHNDDYERQLLAIMLCSPHVSAVRQAAARTKPEWFYRSYHKRLFEMAGEVLEKHPAPACESDGERAWGAFVNYSKARDPDWFDRFGKKLLSEVWAQYTFSRDETWHLESTRWLHERLIQLAIARRRASILNREIDTEVEKLTPEEYAESRHELDQELIRLESEWMQFSQPRKNFAELWESAVLREKRRRSAEGFTFGYESLDSHGGAMPGDFVIVAGRAGVGKTTMVANVIFHRTEQPPVQGFERWGAFFSLDMAPESIAQKLVMRAGKLRASEALEPQYDTSYARITDAWSRYRNIEINGATSLTVDEIIAEVLFLAREHEGVKPEFVVVDYHGKVRHSSKNLRSQYERTSETASQLKDAAKKLDTVMIVLTQLSREAKGGDVEPELYMLRDSGRLEEEADTVLGLWRMDEQTLGMKIMKARMMPLGKFSLDWDPTIGYVGDGRRHEDDGRTKF